MNVEKAPVEPGVPVVDQPSVYCDPPPCVPSKVVDNRKGWLLFELSD